MRERFTRPGELCILLPEGVDRMSQLIKRADSDGLKVVSDLRLIYDLVLVVPKRRVRIVLKLRCRIQGVLHQRLPLLFC